jgi:DHA2 family multidrug resistance protein-like MFS transporter
MGLGSLAAGFWMLPGALGSVFLCMMAPVAIRYASRGKVMATGLLILATGVGLLTQLSTDSLFLLVAAIFLMSGGCGLMVTVGIDKVVSSAPPNKAGAAAGISETSTTFGGAFGVAILGSIWTAFYRGYTGQGIPGQLPAANAAIVRSTIGGAVAEAGKLHNFNLLTMARAAFVNSLHITALICCLFTLVVAALVIVKLRGKKICPRGNIAAYL